MSQNTSSAATPPDDLHDTIVAWAFNVMLECTRTDKPMELAVGGAILDFHDLDRILSWVMGCLPSGEHELQEAQP